MSNEIEKIKQETGIQDLKNLDEEKLNKIIDALNAKKITAEDIKKLIKMFPTEFLGAMQLSAQGIKGSLDGAISTQIQNFQGMTVTQMQVITSVTDSLRTIEETIRLLATQAKSDSFRSKAADVLMELAKYKLKIAKILENINDANNKNRLEMQRENNNFFGGVISGVLAVVGIAAWLASGGKNPPPPPPKA